MKKILILLSAGAIILNSCSKKLDVQPLQSVNEEFVFNTDSNIKAALTGAYDVVSGGYLLGGEFQLYSELLAADGEISWVGTYQQPREIYNKAILTTNSYVENTYTEGYRVINICNNIIANINVVAVADRDRIKAEALFLRGMVYFELVKLYAKPYSDGAAASNPGLQIVTVPTINGQVTAANMVARSSVQETYNQIITDLTTAKPNLSSDFGVYAGSFTASAVLSRVYLQMGNYEAARDEADDVIENSGASLESEYSRAFNNIAPSSEDIYVLPVTAQDGTNDMQLFWSILDYGARDGDVEVNQSHIDLYEPTDARLAFFYLDEYDIYRSGKWKLQYKFLPVIRLSEMYLTRAEANFRLGTTVGNTADDDLTIIRGRAGLAPITATLENIVYERRLELAHEGQRLHDVKRLQGSVDGFDFDANKLVFPIPQREVNAGAGILIQNAGY